MATSGNYYYFLVGFLYIWWIPNMLAWIIYLVGSIGMEKKEENNKK